MEVSHIFDMRLLCIHGVWVTVYMYVKCIVPCVLNPGVPLVEGGLFELGCSKEHVYPLKKWCLYMMGVMGMTMRLIRSPILTWNEEGRGALSWLSLSEPRK